MNRNKYRNIPTTIDGIRFASRKEGRRYQELKLLERAKEIKDLKLQPRFKIVVNDQVICTYVADFSYIECKDARMVVEDVKGVLTPAYKLKKKLVKAVYGIDITET